MDYQRTAYQTLRGKNVLIVGAVAKRKRYVWDVAREHGIKVIYTDTDKDANARNDAAHFIHLDLSDHTKDESNADIVLNILISSGIQIDGCLTFNDDYVVLTALISTKLGLIGIGVEGAKITKSKHKTHTFLRQDPDILDTSPFASRTYRICNKKDIPSAIESIKLPAIVKTEYGCGAYGVTMVTNIEQCLDIFEKLKQLYNSTAGNDPAIQYEFGIGHGRSVVIMEHIGGTEHDVNIIMFKGILIDAFITDNGPTRKDTFFETASSLPTCLPNEKKEELIQAAFLCCTKLGLLSGVFNVEMKMTEIGPKLLEINPRLPGYCSRCYILQLYGIDLVVCAFLISCGIKPVLPNQLQPYGHIMGVMCVASIHGLTLKTPTIQRRIETLSLNKEIGHLCIYDESFFIKSKTEIDYLCGVIYVKEHDLGAAKRKLLKVCDDLGINTSEYPVSYFLKDFRSV